MTFGEELYALLGKRSDDAAVLAFHKKHALKPPPVVRETDCMYDVQHKTRGFAVNYQAEVRVPGLYPPRKENGRYVAWLTSATLYPAFEGPIVGTIDTSLTEKQAKKFEKGTWKTPIYRGLVVDRRDDREVCFVFDVDEGTLVEVRVQLMELERGDPKLEQAAKPVKAQLAATAQKRTFPDAKAAKAVAFPQALKALFELQRDAGLGEIDFELGEGFDSGGPTAWLGNKEAEHQFRVFGQDGSGGLVAFWLVNRKGSALAPIEQQPVVFLGSEGKVGPVAKDLPDFFQLLAAGVGPLELVEYGVLERQEAQPAIARLATKHFAGLKKRKIDVILDEAAQALGDFEEHVEGLNRHR